MRRVGLPAFRRGGGALRAPSSHSLLASRRSSPRLERAGRRRSRPRRRALDDAAHDTPLELLASRIASHIAGRPVSVSCESYRDWVTVVSAQGGDPNGESGFVATEWDGATRAAHLALVRRRALRDSICLPLSSSRRRRRSRRKCPPVNGASSPPRAGRTRQAAPAKAGPSRPPSPATSGRGRPPRR